MVEEAGTFANRDDVLEACSNGNILKLRDIFHNSHRLGQDQTSEFAPPMESSLIEAMMDRAIQHDQPDILRYILTLSSGLKIPERAVRFALLSPSAEMYDITLHARSKHYLSNHFRGRRSPVRKGPQCPGIT